MKAIGERSLAAGLRVFLDVLRIAIWVVLGLIVALAVLGVVTYSTGIEGGFLGVEVENVDPWYVVAFVFGVHFFALAASLVVVGRLRRIFATLSAGDPFVPENAEHLRAIALVIAVFEAARLGAGLIFGALFDSLGATASDGLEPSVEINLIVWFSVLSLFVLAEVFKEGSRLRHDQQMTI
jgi:hypothetical protein